MKRINFLLLIVTISTLFTFNQCKKNKDVPQLPPETTTGAMTFGCKVNGEIFVPKDGGGKPGLFCQYVNLGNVPDGGWHLNIPAYNYSTKRGISIETDSLLLVEGGTYEFGTVEGTANAFYIVNNNTTGGVDVYSKLMGGSGQLYISKFDSINRILSGTFFFTGTKVSTGEKVTVTDGRFDIRY